MSSNEAGRKKQRLYVDMDGTLAVFTPVDELEMLYEKGYFLNQEPHENVVEAVREIIQRRPDIEVHILSAYLTDSEYALQEKNEWLDRHLPQIDQEHRIFVPCGSDKKAGIEGGIRSNDYLLDDYTKNLDEWHPPARGIKLLNAINHTRGTWAHDRISYDKNPTQIANDIYGVVTGAANVFDERPWPPRTHSNESEEGTMENGRSTLGNDKAAPDPGAVAVKGARWEKHLHFNDEQYKIARHESSALAYARAKGYDLVKESANTYHLREHDSMVFRTDGSWFWNSHGLKGGAIEFLMHYEGKTLPEAVLTLSDGKEHPLSGEKARQPSVPYKKDPLEKKPFAVPSRSDNYRQMFAYLVKGRGLDNEIITSLAKQGLVYPTKYVDKKNSNVYTNVVFAGVDPSGSVRSAFQRGSATNSTFKMEINGSDKTVPFAITAGEPSAKTLCVFEGAIDAISHASVQKLAGADWQGCHRISQGGNAPIETITKFLDAHPAVDTVRLCFDNDSAGRIMSKQVHQNLIAVGYQGKIENVPVPSGKDWNEYLQTWRETVASHRLLPAHEHIGQEESTYGRIHHIDEHGKIRKTVAYHNKQAFGNDSKQMVSQGVSVIVETPAQVERVLAQEQKKRKPTAGTARG